MEDEILSIETERCHRAVIVLPIGRIDARNARKIEEIIEDYIIQDNTRFVFDCQLMNYISSAGLGVLLVIARRIQELAGQIRFCNLSKSVRQVFEVSGFTTLIDVDRNRNAALAALDD